MSEQPKIESQPQQEEIEKSKTESEFQSEKFDKFMVPEDWIEDLSEAQKEAYRVKVYAFSIKRGRESMLPETKTDDDQPSSQDYEWAKIRRSMDTPGPHVVSETKAGEMFRKVSDFVGDNIADAYLELRARMLARSERRKEKEK